MKSVGGNKKQPQQQSNLKSETLKQLVVVVVREPLAKTDRRGGSDR